VHLAKDHVLRRGQFQRLFPEYRRFLQIKRRLDPDELFQSDMYRRLIRDTTIVDRNESDMERKLA